MLLPSGYSTYNYSVSATGKGWGPGWPQCSAGPMVTVRTKRSGTPFTVHARISKLVLLLMDEIERRGWMVGPYGTWSLACRAISGTSVSSNHSWGLAFDLRAPYNPYTSGGRNAAFREYWIPDWAYALFRAYGFGLGADYTGQQDWMHGEFMGTPADADVMTALAVRAFATVVPPKPKEFPEGPMQKADQDWIREAIQVYSRQAVDAALVQFRKEMHDLVPRGVLVANNGEVNGEYTENDSFTVGVQGKTINDVIKRNVESAVKNAVAEALKAPVGTPTEKKTGK